MAIAPVTIEVYQAHAKSLVSYASALVGPSQAEDLVAQAMVRVFDRVDLGAVDNPRGYLFTAVLNQARSDGRSAVARRRREAAYSADRGVAQPVALPDELGLLRSLSARQRAVVYLTYWEDLTVADVADTLGLSDGTVRRYLARARTKIRKEIQP